MDNKRAIYLITDKDFFVSTWQEAWPDAHVLSSQEVTSILSPSIIIVLAQSENWLTILEHFSKQEIPILVLSKQGNSAELDAAMAAGARGYINLFSEAHLLMTAAQSIMDGALWIPPKYLESLLRVANKALPTTAEDSVFSNLSQREAQVAELVVQGLSNKLIARKLDICERTVKLHVSSILNKLNIADRIQLILLKKGRT